jgi:hypothetical protein
MAVFTQDSERAVQLDRCLARGLAASEINQLPASFLGFQSSPSVFVFHPIEHHKIGAISDRILEADDVKFYADTEDVLAKLTAGYQWPFASLETGLPSGSHVHIVQRVRKATS